MVGIPGLSFTSQKTNVISDVVSSVSFNPTSSISVGGSVGQSPYAGGQSFSQSPTLTSVDPAPQFSLSPGLGAIGTAGALAGGLISPRPDVSAQSGAAVVPQTRASGEILGLPTPLVLIVGAGAAAYFTGLI